MRSSPWLRRGGLLLGALWTSPWTLLGLLAGMVGLAAGASVRISRRERALVFQRWPWGPGGAMTLGNVILDTGDDLGRTCNTYAHDAGHGHEPRIRLCDHERAHVLQYMALGVLFLPLYLLHGGVAARNPFERAADRYARTGRGWWPWSRP